MALVQPSIHIRPYVALALAFTFSACSLAYQQLLVFALSDVSGDFVLSQSLGLGIFLLGMGLGTWRATHASIGRLMVIEFSLSLLGFISIFAIYAGEVLLRYFYPSLPPVAMVFVFLPLVLLIGFCTGQELPLVIGLCPRLPTSRVLAFNYFGGIVALIMIPLVMLPIFDLAKSAFLVALINFCVAYSLIWFYVPSRVLQVAGLAVVLTLIPWLKFEPVWRDLHLKFIYFPVAYSEWDTVGKDWENFDQMDAPLRQRSRFQWIDVIPTGATVVDGQENAFSIYLDRKFQLNALTERRYHEAMVEGGIQLLGRVPRRVLVLGGGDGLLLTYLRKHSGVENIDLVEIDPAMVNLGRNHRELSRLNQQSISDPRVAVHVVDAFAYVRAAAKTAGERYDLILIDFPLPSTYELSLLYTREFYAFTRALLTSDGLALMDFALPDKKLDSLSVLVATLKEAGFEKPMAFGHEDLFLAMSRSANELKFDFTQAPSNQVLRSFSSMQNYLQLAAEKPSRVNTLFFPYRFEFDYSSPTTPTLEDSLRSELLKRYHSFHAREFFDYRRILSPQLSEALDSGIARVEWEHRFQTGQPTSTILHMFACSEQDVNSKQNVITVRSLWRQAFSVPGEDWCGISYDFQMRRYVTHKAVVGGFDSSDGTSTRQTLSTWETRQNGELIFTRYRGSNLLNVVPGSRESDVLGKVFSEFMIMPSSYTMTSKTKILGIFYP